MLRGLVRVGLPVICLIVSTATASAQLVFNFTNSVANPPTAQMVTGFQQAGAMWSAIFNDNITINVTIGGASLGSGIIGSTSNQQTNFTYSQTRTALLNDKTSADDTSTTNNLPNSSVVSMLINHTLNNPAGANSATPYFDTGLGGSGQAGSQNNSTIRMSRSNAKALGLIGTSSANDGTITFSTNFSFDFDRSNGISAGQIDFVGVAAHEIGHLLGFTSGVDVLDGNGTGHNDNEFTNVSTLDLFRFSTRSVTTGGVGAGVGVIDWTADNTAKYFSVNGGLTNLALFSNGVTLGDGRQASHWKDNLGIGIMDPTAGNGELLAITSNDIRALDAIGFNRIDAVPEPTVVALFGVAGVTGVIYFRRRYVMLQKSLEQVVG